MDDPFTAVVEEFLQADVERLAQSFVLLHGPNKALAAIEDMRAKALRWDTAKGVAMARLWERVLEQLEELG